MNKTLRQAKGIIIRTLIFSGAALLGMVSGLVIFSFTRPEPSSLSIGISNTVAAKKEEVKVEDITLIMGETKIIIKGETLAGWLTETTKTSLALRKGLNPIAGLANKKPYYAIKPNGKAMDYLRNVAAPYEIQPIDAVLNVEDGKVTAFALSKGGVILDLKSTISNLEFAVNAHRPSAELVLKDKKPTVTEDNYAELGIRELIASGTSTYPGSPSNRRRDIEVGASKFQGVLIKPGQTFSFDTYLGLVDASTGYLPELVILKDTTTPEYGGGLCQVSTTMFRAALNAGLPIIERHIHAYPVVYYAPYGTDATIYPPSPDLKFTNDTGHYILIQAKKEYSRLTFEFYGTKPARSVGFSGYGDNQRVGLVEQVSPRIWDYGARGPRSFSAEFYRFRYDSEGKLLGKDRFTSMYESPDKYPHQ